MTMIAVKQMTRFLKNLARDTRGEDMASPTSPISRGILVVAVAVGGAGVAAGVATAVNTSNNTQQATAGKVAAAAGATAAAPAATVNAPFAPNH
jgi:hypothetical protein